MKCTFEKKTDETHVKIFELSKPIDEHKYVCVSTKENGVGGLCASCFAYASSGPNLEDVKLEYGRELYFGYGDDSYNHEEIIKKLYNNEL